jgi:cephalosporin-C deacetylase-like acetyl esterase
MTTANPSIPADFDAYWANTMRELAALPAAAELTAVPLRATEFSTHYEVRMTSIGPYRIFGYYTVPHGDGPFPVVYHTPGYGSVVHIAPHEERQQYITLALRHRGQRLADQPFAAAYPGLLTTGIESPESYIYRGIVADCVRAVDFLLDRPEVDAKRIAVTGDDLALFTAALRPQVTALYYAPAFFFDARRLAPRTSAYPQEELNDYARYSPAQADAMWRTLEYFSPMHFAQKVKAETMLVTGNEKDLLSPDVVAPLAAAFPKPVDRYISAHSSYRDGVHRLKWLAQRHGVGEAALPPHWQQGPA